MDHPLNALIGNQVIGGGDGNSFHESAGLQAKIEIFSDLRYL